jgi:hypothetical protein
MSRCLVRRLGLVTFVALFALGCAPGRIADLKDSGRVSFGVGLGLSADIKAGALTHPSLGLWSASAMFGFDTRKVDGLFFEGRTSEPYATFWTRGIGTPWGQALNSTGWRVAFEAHEFQAALAETAHVPQRERPEALIAHIEKHELDGTLDVGGWLPFPRRTQTWDSLFSFKNTTDLQAGAQLLFVTARVGFNPLEFLDFLGGMLGADIAGDDQDVDDD